MLRQAKSKEERRPAIEQVAVLGFLASSDAKQGACNIKIEDQGYGIDDRGDEGTCHNGRVEPESLGKDRQAGADKLGDDDGAKHGQGDDGGDRKADAVDQHCFSEHDRAEYDSAQKRDEKLLV